MGIRSKFESYMGFCAKSGNLITGYNTCLSYIPKNKIKLLIISEDVKGNTFEKLKAKCISNNVEYRVYGKAEVLCKMIGKVDKGLIGITDTNFARVILKEIDSQEKEADQEV